MNAVVHQLSFINDKKWISQLKQFPVPLKIKELLI